MLLRYFKFYSFFYILYSIVFNIFTTDVLVIPQNAYLNEKWLYQVHISSPSLLVVSQLNTLKQVYILQSRTIRTKRLKTAILKRCTCQKLMIDAKCLGR